MHKMCLKNFPGICEIGIIVVLVLLNKKYNIFYRNLNYQYTFINLYIY